MSKRWMRRFHCLLRGLLKSDALCVRKSLQRAGEVTLTPGLLTLGSRQMKLFVCNAGEEELCSDLPAVVFHSTTVG